MDEAITVEVVATVGPVVVEAMQRLLPQLSPSALVPTAEQLREIVESGATDLMLARDGTERDQIVGCLTLALVRTPTGMRAWIEDVVVDANARRRGVGEAMIREALRLAASRGAQTVELTSSPARAAANRLYRRVGFQLRETNVYRYSIEGEHVTHSPPQS